MLERVNSPSDYISAERKIKKSNDLIDINIAFLSKLPESDTRLPFS